MRLVLLALLAACNKAPEVECVDAGDCDGLSVCTEAGTCRTVQCLSSDDCAIGSHCNLDAYQCFTGCQEDDDCTVGQVCDTDTTTCVQGECTDAVTDCWPGQTCTDGACARPAGMCEACTTSSSDPCVVDHGGTCRYLYGQFGYDYYCLLPCDPASTEPGPRDFVCEDISYTSTPIFRWWGDCSRALEAPAE